MKDCIRVPFLVVIAALVLFAPRSGRCAADNSPFVVRDAKTAVRLAEAVIEQEYGKQELNKLIPLVATKSGDRWIVRGVRDKHTPKRTRGGIAVVEIALESGCILAVHYQI
jgi:hypothetical protein